jgi:hypothetical protein
MILVAKEHLSLYSPMIIYPIGIKEVHTPTLLRRRKTP